MYRDSCVRLSLHEGLTTNALAPVDRPLRYRADHSRTKTRPPAGNSGPAEPSTISKARSPTLWAFLDQREPVKEVGIRSGLRNDRNRTENSWPPRHPEQQKGG